MTDTTPPRPTPPFRLTPRLHPRGATAAKPTAAAHAADEALLVRWKHDLHAWRDGRQDLVRLLVTPPMRPLPEGGPSVVARLETLRAADPTAQDALRDELATLVTTTILPCHTPALRAHCMETRRLHDPATYGPAPLPPVAAIARLLTQPAERHRLRLLRDEPRAPLPDDTPSLSPWVRPWLHGQPAGPARPSAEEGAERVLEWEVHLRDETPLWAALQPVWQAALDQWITEHRAEPVEWSPLWNRLAQLRERATGEASARRAGAPSETGPQWWGQSAHLGPIDLDLPASAAWLTQHALSNEDLQAHLTQAGPWRRLLLQHSPSVVEPSALLARLKTLGDADLRALLRNPHLSAAGLRLVRNWALFDLTHSTSDTPAWDAGEGLSTRVLNALSTAGYGLSPEDLERLEHAVAFSTAPGLRARFVRVADVMRQPWAAAKLLAPTRKGTFTLDVISRVVGAAPYLRGEDWEEILTGLLRIDDQAIGSPDLQARALTRTLARLSPTAVAQTNRAQWRTLLLHPSKAVREMTVRRMSDLALQPDADLALQPDAGAADAPAPVAPRRPIVLPARQR